MAPFCCGDLVFVPGPQAFEAGTVVSVERLGEFVEVERESGATERFPIHDLRQRFFRDDGATAQDNTALVYMNDATILENLQKRHARDEIYTYTASVLLAVNPYKDIRGLYGEEQCVRYRGKHIGALPPHPYAIADTAYRALVREKRNQGLLISGESGAGKTETAKIVMQFLAYTSGAVSTHAENIQARVLRAQPILESFGNAVTMRNSNSSRFGKYNRVFFDNQGALVDAGITTYLLESSRVVTHGSRERTYHCFYELLRGVDDAKLQEFQLDRDRKYRLLTNGCGEFQSGFESRDNVNFHRMVDSLRTMGFDQADVDNMLRVLAGLIHLGDIDKVAETCEEDEDEIDTTKPVEVDDEVADRAARLLGMDPAELTGRLTRKKVAVPGRSSFHEVPRSAKQFKHTKQSFIKALYKRLFDRIVARINDSFKDLRPSNFRQFRDEDWAHIGILDIYGFENLMKNSFEQLCINLANERLQQYFVENVLLAEQDLYKREGLPWIGLAVPDAQPVFLAIDKIFKTLDEYSQNLTRSVGNATDTNFCQKILDEGARDPVRRDVLKQIKMTSNGRKSIVGMKLNEGFVIKHYAGQVQYLTEGWLDKNNDRLVPECEALICEATNPLVVSMGEQDSITAKGQQFRSISKKYTKDLEALLETLSTCNLHYIRCFKPNAEQKGDSFAGPLVLDQVVQCGTIELVKLMHDGYPNRCSFEEISTRFRDLLPEKFQRYGMRTFIEALMMAYDVPAAEWALGMSRLFLKAGQLKALEEMRDSGTLPSAERLEQIVSVIIRKKWRRAVHAVGLCNYVPKFLAWIKQQKAQKKWRFVSLFVTRFLPKVYAAKRRVAERHAAARRRFVGAVRAVQFSQDCWSTVRSKRRERVVNALYLRSRVHVQMRRRLAVARDNIAHELARQAEMRRHEEERRLRAEEEMRRMQEAAAEEARRAEEEMQRVQEAARLEAEQKALEMEAERKRIAEEAEARVEAEKRRLEEEAEAQQRAAEEKAKDAARLREEEIEQMRNEWLREKEEQEKKMAREKEEQEKTLAEERSKIQQERLAMEDEHRRNSMFRTQASPQRSTQKVPTEVGRRLSEGTSMMDQTSTTEDDVGDSISNYTVQVQQLEMQQTLAKLQEEMEQKHLELQRQMAVLEEQNKHLQSELRVAHSQPAPWTPSGTAAAAAATAQSPNPSLIALDEPTAPLPSTPDRTPDRSTSRARAGQFPSPLSIEGSAARNGTKKRHSIATAGLMAQENAEQQAQQALVLGEPAVASTSDVGPQRRWWAEQRQFLLEDLYGNSPESSAGTQRRLSTSFQPQVKQGPGRSLNDAFAAEDGSSGTPGSAAGSGASKIKQPTDFDWTGKPLSQAQR